MLKRRLTRTTRYAMRKSFMFTAAGALTLLGLFTGGVHENLSVFFLDLGLGATLGVVLMAWAWWMNNKSNTGMQD